MTRVYGQYLLLFMGKSCLIKNQTCCVFFTQNSVDFTPGLWLFPQDSTENVSASHSYDKKCRTSCSVISTETTHSYKANPGLTHVICASFLKLVW